MNEEGFISFECEHCHTAIEASPDMIGEATECPACGQKLTIPADQDDGVARHGNDDRPRPPDKPRKAGPSGSNSETCERGTGNREWGTGNGET